MPIYEYQCSECKQIFEEWQKDFKERTHSCPVCGSEAERLISNTSFILKGSGWYVTDYKGANSSTSASANTSSNGNGDNGSTTKASDASTSASPKTETAATSTAASDSSA